MAVKMQRELKEFLLDIVTPVWVKKPE